MPISPVSSLTPAGQATAAAAPAFDGDDFMQLLLAQLRHQDPLNPVRDQEFMAQLAQMNTLVEVQKLNATLEAMQPAQAIAQAASLIGRAVQAVSDGRTLEGVVAAVQVNGADVMLDLNGPVVKLADVRAVREADRG